MKTGVRTGDANFETLLYTTTGPVATITLNRPEQLNTIVPPMPDEIEAAIGLAERDHDIKVIVLRGAGRAFSGGYDFGGGFQHWGDAMMTDGRWDPGKDFAMVTARETGPTQKFMAIWRASKPVIAQVHGWCVGGGQRLRAVRRSRHRQRRRRDRHPIQPDVRRLPDRHVALPTEPGQGQVALVDRPTADRRPGRRSRADQRGGAVRAFGGPRRRDRRRAGTNPAVAVAGAEADRQPGLREHGPGIHADAGRHP